MQTKVCEAAHARQLMPASLPSLNRSIAVINKTIMATIANPAQTQGVYVNVPMVDWSLFRELIKKFGWKAETREQLLDRFVGSRPTTPEISEEEIMDEVRAVRYAK